MKIEVEGSGTECSYVCPFIDMEYGICNVAPGRPLCDYPMAPKESPPATCPLRNGSITVKLIQ